MRHSGENFHEGIDADFLDGVSTAGYVPTAQTIKADTTTAYVMVAGDVNKLVTLSNAAAVTFTVPADADAVFAIGSKVEGYQLGAGQVTVTAGAGATLRVSGATAKSLAQYARFRVEKVAANTWVVDGTLAAS